jgi:hypothetical protein
LSIAQEKGKICLHNLKIHSLLYNSYICGAKQAPNNKTTILTLHQQLYLDFSPTILEVPITAAVITSTTIVQLRR